LCYSPEGRKQRRRRREGSCGGRRGLGRMRREAVETVLNSIGNTCKKCLNEMERVASDTTTTKQERERRGRRGSLITVVTW